ncbi:MAG: tRNA 2-thiouridine(34) synthase MnmA [Magnetococcales bacterium]|nr:tRNA 2-thiouridine(34) synthase MnmA [Magnetococcales bacterium]MBF0115320.1 tRNA 2-thiouridine(34) synthase MnmA [Magnetococcales bacterium]
MATDNQASTPVPGKTRVAVAMSGGVDSAVAAALLLQQGYEVIGLTMRLWSGSSGDPTRRSCCSTEDVQDARRVAQTLGIPFYIVDLETEFRQAVVDDFVQSYGHGLTPNPCIRCNQHLKFDFLLRRALALQAQFLATGHYAQRVESSNGVQLWRGLDRSKDQSYFLFTVTSAQLQHLRFPLGGLQKAETRALAEQFGLHLAEKSESQDLCFVPDGDKDRFLRLSNPGMFQSGEIVDLQGNRLGRHNGLACYTVGQRKGLGIAHAQPLYVIALDQQENRLVVGPESALWQDCLRVQGLNWLESTPLQAPRRVWSQIRYAAQAQPGWLTPLGGDQADIQFDQPQRAIAPGQAAVFYEEQRLLGGGWIQGELCAPS